MERRVFELTIDGEDVELTEDNHGIALFRDEPEKDYLTIRVDEERRILVFRQRQLLLWMGRLAIQEGDEELLYEMEEQHGQFSGRTGWNSRVYLQDTATSDESELFIRYLSRDLDEARGADDLLG